jgi:hypothetical protein
MKSLYVACFSFIWLLAYGGISATPEHPRLLVTAAEWENLPAIMKADPRVDHLISTVVARADKTFDMPLLKYEREGRRILAVSRDAIQRILDLSTAWKVTKEKKYLDRARDEMLAICKFPNWNPNHHLDTAEMQSALAIGYDWLFHDLTDEERKIISTTLIEKGLKSSLEHDYVFGRHNNWNQVCVGGLVLSAIALSDIEPELSSKAIDAAMKAIPIGLKAGYPADGAYAEGGGYWSYGTIYTILSIEALRTAGLPYENILSHPGFLESGFYIRQVYGSSNKLFNYGDNQLRPLSFKPTLAWMAKQNQSKQLSDFITPTIREVDSSNQDRFLALAAFWLPEKTDPKEKPIPLHYQGTGHSPIAIHRTGFENKDLYLGIKAGGANVSHGHMDAGSFVIDWAGKRWISDLGVQTYHPLESTGINLFEMTQDSDRWQVFRLNNFSHNTLTYNGQLHIMKGKSVITSSKGEPEHETLLDLAPPLGLPKNATATRRFKMDTENRSITITDSLKGLKANDLITWRIFTPAAANATDDGFLLSFDQTKMRLKLTSPQAVDKQTSPSDPPPKAYDEANPGITHIRLNAKADESGEIVIEAVLKAQQN